MAQEQARPAGNVTTVRVEGITVRTHWLTRPWGEPVSPTATLQLAAKELIPAGGEQLPIVVYLTGGPGFPGPRPDTYTTGVIGTLLKTHRVVIVDYRGTGLSAGDWEQVQGQAQVQRLLTMRADVIVADLEAWREYFGVSRWELFGQSYGGFIITTYLSKFPYSVRYAYLTGGLPAVGHSVDEVYTATYQMLAQRWQQACRRYPELAKNLDTVQRHLDQAQASGEPYQSHGMALSGQMVGTIGINLGRHYGFNQLNSLLDTPVLGGRLRQDLVAALAGQTTFAGHPLYALIHESIYGRPGEATNWAATRLNPGLPVTGEHILKFQFSEDPALIPYAAAAEQLAQYTNWTNLYNPDALADAGPVAAQIYLDDLFVPAEFSRETAAMFGDCRVRITNSYQHDGIHHAGSDIIQALMAEVRAYGESR